MQHVINVPQVGLAAFCCPIPCPGAPPADARLATTHVPPPTHTTHRTCSRLRNSKVSISNPKPPSIMSSTRSAYLAAGGREGRAGQVHMSVQHSKRAPHSCHPLNMWYERGGWPSTSRVLAATPSSHPHSPASIMADRSWGHSRKVRRRALPAMSVMGPLTSRTSCCVMA